MQQLYEVPPMTNHAELSKELALALGYHPESVRIYTPSDECPRVYRQQGPHRWPTWYDFDYRSPDVCLPLLKWLIDKHCAVVYRDVKSFRVDQSATFDVNRADTLEEAVARAVIAVGVR